MPHKIIDDWFSGILGVFGFGVTFINVDVHENLPRLLVSMTTAAVAGGMGYIGKLAAVWALRKSKSFYSRIKPKKMSIRTSSPQWRLNAYDFGKALLVAACSQPITLILTSISAGHFNIDWRAMGLMALGSAASYLLKNFVTPAQTISTRIVILLVMCAGLALPTHAQSPFKPVPRVVTFAAHNPFAKAAIVQKDSSLNAWRIISVAAAYAEPGNILMAGIGYGYQHLSWDYTAEKWICKWSISPVAFAGGSVAPSTPASVMSVGVLGGINNNLIMAGPVYNFGTKQFGVAVSIGINFNN